MFESMTTQIEVHIARLLHAKALLGGGGTVKPSVLAVLRAARTNPLLQRSAAQ
jgi:hypothetical protein